MRKRFCSAVAAASVAALLAGAEWPQWRGPFHNGSTDAANLPAAAKDNVLWTAPMPGRGASTPVVWGNRVFVTSTVGATDELAALCLDAATGAVLWQIPAGKNREALSGNTMATPSPATDGRHVYFLFGTGRLIAADFGGAILWTRALEDDHGEFVIKYGYSGSPLLYQGRLYIAVLQNKDPARYHASERKGPLDSFLLALDPASGKDLWKHVRASDTPDESSETYVTPMPYEGAGRAEILLPGAEFLTGHDAATGAELWRWEYTPRGREGHQRLIPSAVPGEKLVYALRGRGRALYAVKGGANGTAGEGQLAWTLSESCPDEATPLLYKGKLYVLSGNKKTMTCLDAATGEQAWQGRLGGGATWYASPTAGDGKIYCLSERGELMILAAGGSFEILFRGELGAQQGSCRSSVAIAGERLYVRTEKSLYCIGSAARTGAR